MSAPVSVLMYHRLGAGAIPGRETGEELYALTPARFEEQLAAVAATKRPVLGLGELQRRRAGGGGGPAVCLTFDDGNASDHEHALPALARRGWSALFFVVPAWTGTAGYMDRGQLRELAAAGMTVGAHGYDHTWLATLDDAGVRRQMRDAREALADALGEPPSSISLPGGSGGARAVRMAGEAGFELVATSQPRPARPARSLAPLPRFAVQRDHGAGVVAALAAQSPAVVWRWRARHDLLQALRSTLGERLYARLRGRWAAGQGPRAGGTGRRAA